MSKGLKSTARLGDCLSIGALFRAFWGRIATTWSIVALENTLIALIPFMIGLTIDGLLASRHDELFAMIAVLVLLGAISVIRRLYDTRAYGAIRVHLGAAVDTAHASQNVSTRNTRLDLSRELVDFLEYEAPEIMTSAIQIAVGLIVLTLFDIRLGATSIAVIIGMLIVYGLFHKRFYRLNAELNAAREKQVAILDRGGRIGVLRHLRALRKSEVSISDTESVVYGGIFMLQIAYIAGNLVIAVGLPDLTAGRIFSIATYSWEYAEAALALPIALQSWSRLSEITARINSASDENAPPDVSSAQNHS